MIEAVLQKHILTRRMTMGETQPDTGEIRDNDGINMNVVDGIRAAKQARKENLASFDPSVQREAQAGREELAGGLFEQIRDERTEEFGLTEEGN